MDSALSSMFSITRLATTTDTRDPIAVPCTCWYTFPRKDRKVASKQSDRRSVMSFTLRPVLLGREASQDRLHLILTELIDHHYGTGVHDVGTCMHDSHTST